MRKRAIISFLMVVGLSFGSWVSLRAQEANEGIGLREFTVLGYGDSLFEGLCFEQTLGEESEVTCLEFFPNRRSRRYPIDASTKELSFFTLEKDAKGNEVRKDRGQVRLPSGESNLFLLFDATESFHDTGRYSITVLDESDEEWGAGCFRFLNLTGSPLFCEIGDISGDLGVGLSAIVRFPLENRKPMPLRFSVDWEGTQQVIYATDTLPDLKVGKFIVIKPPADPASMRIRVFTIWQKV